MKSNDFREICTFSHFKKCNLFVKIYILVRKNMFGTSSHLVNIDLFYYKYCAEKKYLKICL